jgi:putative ABC transport system ATP-binding protein
MELSVSEREKLRRYQIGFVFQSVALIPIMSAYENVDFGLRLAEYQDDRDKRIRQVMHLVGLTKRMKHMPGQMSGGEQQRVAIARAVAHKPKVIFADEPTGALDTASGLAVMKLFRELVEQEGITIVMTTHDPGLMELGDVVYEMEDGEIVGREEHWREP